MRNLKICLLLISICTCQSLYAQIKTLKGKNLSSTEVDHFIRQQMDSLKIPAISIVLLKNNKIVYHRAIGIKNAKQERIDNNTIFEAASMTKTVFAYTVLKLVKKNVLSLDTPLYKYYPYEDIKHDERYKLITARMVLNHTTGFPNWRGDDKKLTINATPGTKFGYSGEGFEYLGLVIKHLTGKKLDDLIQEYVFRPLSIKNSYLVSNEYVKKHLTEGLKDNKDWGNNDVYLQPYVSYSLYTEAIDYAKFEMELMKESTISNSIFQAMSVPQQDVGIADSRKGAKTVACLGIFTEQTPFGPIYLHPGNNDDRFTSIFQFYKDPKIGFVYFINCPKQNELTKRLNEFLINGK
jgi:CubicO group peptidase (beta-lactamase class C family)